MWNKLSYLLIIHFRNLNEDLNKEQHIFWETGYYNKKIVAKYCTIIVNNTVDNVEKQIVII